MEIEYGVVGFTDKNKIADFSRERLTEIGSKRIFNRLKNSGDYQCVVRRKETEEYGIIINGPIQTWEI